MIPITRSQILVANATDSVEGVLDRMAGSRVGSIIIVNSGRVLGIFTERDVLFKWRMWTNQATLKRPISEFMSEPVITIRANDIGQAAQLMLEKHIRHLPVLDNRHNLIGVLSIRDLLPAVGEIPLQSTLQPAAQKQMTIHFVTLNSGLEEVIKEILPSGWNSLTWNAVESMVAGADFKTHLQKPDTAVFVDLDGMSQKERLVVLKDLIGLMKMEEHPKVFFCYSTDKVTDDEVVQLRQIAKKTNWYIFEKPLALAQLVAAFQTTGAVAG